MAEAPIKVKRSQKEEINSVVEISSIVHDKNDPKLKIISPTKITPQKHRPIYTGNKIHEGFQFTISSRFKVTLRTVNRNKNSLIVITYIKHTSQTKYLHS